VDGGKLSIVSISFPVPQSTKGIEDKMTDKMTDKMMDNMTDDDAQATIWGPTTSFEEFIQVLLSTIRVEGIRDELRLTGPHCFWNRAHRF
jgi:hypothetical protein